MPAIVLLPGYLCDNDLWTGMRQQLDAIGPASVAGLTSSDTLEGLAADVLAAAPERFVLVGFSMGGYVARIVAATAPERVIALALINTSARANTADEVARNRRRVETLRTLPFRGLSRAAVAEALHPDRRGDTALLDRLQAMAVRVGKHGMLNQTGLVRKDGHAQLERIACPTLVVASRQDTLRPVAEIERMVGHLRQPTYRVVEHCGHMTPLERPAELAAILTDWLSAEAVAIG